MGDAATVPYQQFKNEAILQHINFFTPTGTMVNKNEIATLHCSSILL